MVRVIDAYSVKPIDRETLHRAARDTQGKLVVSRITGSRVGSGTRCSMPLSTPGSTGSR